MTTTGYEELSDQNREPIREHLTNELASNIYDLGKKLYDEVLESVGIVPAALPAQVRPHVLVTADKRVVEIQRRSLSADKNELLMIEAKEWTDEWSIAFQAGRYFEAASKMWQEADSSQGDPWIERPLNLETLVDLAQLLDSMSVGIYDAKITLEVHRQAQLQ